MLRGIDGKQIVELDPQGYTVRTGASVPGAQGDTLVTSIDRDVQTAGRAVAGQADRRLAQGRQAGHGRRRHRHGPATPGASSPPPATPPTTRRIFVGGISTADYAALTDPSAGVPLLDRAIAGRVRARLDVQAHHLVLAGHAPRDQHHRPLQLPGIAVHRRTGEDQLRLRGAGRHHLARRARLLVRHVLLPPDGRRVLRRPVATGQGPTGEGAAAAHGGGVRRRTGAGRRPAGRRAGERQLRRPRDPAGPLEGQPSRLLRRRAQGLPADQERLRPRLPHGAGQGELHRRLALPRR